MQHFEPNYFAAIEKIIAIENHSYAERTIKHMSLLYTVYEIIHSKLKLPVGMEVFQDHLIGSFRAQQEILENISEANQFWHIIDLLFFESKLKESTDFRLTSKNGKDILLIHFSRIYHKYRQHCQVDKKEYLDQHTLLMLLKSKKYFHPGWQKGRADTVTDKMLGSCYAFESNQLPINISLWQK
jgi:hypothetical protein